MDGSVITKTARPTTAREKPTRIPWTCESCDYFVAAQCHRHAPTGLGLDAGWPRVEPGCTCGEHSREDNTLCDVAVAIGELTDVIKGAFKAIDVELGRATVEALCTSIGSAGRTIAAAFNALTAARRGGA